MALTKITGKLKDVRKVKKPKPPKMGAPARVWEAYKDKYNDWVDYQNALDVRRKMR